MKGNYNEIREGDALQQLKEIDDDSIDLIVTDPPYGYSFMNKDWDKAVVSVDVWRECLRVLKAGAFAFVMSAPRQDVLSRMIVNLQDAGFRTDFTSIYWTYASGFPKAANVSKLADKRNGRNYDTRVKDYLNEKRNEKGLSFQQINEYLGTATNGGGVASAIMGDKQFNELPTVEIYNKLKPLLELDDRFDEFIEREEAEREIIGQKKKADLKNHVYFGDLEKAKIKGRAVGYGSFDITKSATEAAKKLDGSYAGFQPKPAVEVVLTVMKPLSEKSFVDQALANGKGVTWLDSVRIPFKDANDIGDPFRYKTAISSNGSNEGWKRPAHKQYEQPIVGNEKGRFPANLLVSDDALNDGKIRKSTGDSGEKSTSNRLANVYGDYSGDAIGNGLGGYKDEGSYSRYFDLDKWYSANYNNRAQFIITPKASPSERQGSTHPTMKPIKLMSYLITMGSRENDIVLDPFCGSGTTLIAAQQLHRKWIGIELNKEYVEIARKRIEPYLVQQKLL